MVAKLLVEHAGLNVFVVLVFVAAIFADIPCHLMVEDLADRNAGVNPDRLDREHFQRPIATKTDIAKASCHVNEQA